MKYLISIILILISLNAAAKPALPLYKENDLVCARILSDKDWQRLVFKYGSSSYPALQIRELVTDDGLAYMVDSTGIIPPDYKYKYLTLYILESNIIGVANPRYPTCRYPK